MLKFIFDVFFAAIGLFIVSPILFVSWLAAAIDTRSNGWFTQQRIGKNAKPFIIYKLKTMHPNRRNITALGNFIRKYKLDELPQLMNILKGEMSFVGPRPDISGYADVLENEDRIVLQLRPGITGLASLKYRNEERLLQVQEHPLDYNDKIIWPDKVRINKWYALNRTFRMDLFILFYTFFPFLFDIELFVKKYDAPRIR